MGEGKKIITIMNNLYQLLSSIVRRLHAKLASFQNYSLETTVFKGFSVTSTME